MAVHVTDLLSDYSDDALSGATLSKVKSHLTFCNACRRALKELQDNIYQLKKSSAATLPPELEKRILTKILDEPATEPTPLPVVAENTVTWTWLRNFKLWGMVSACAVVLFIVRANFKDDTFAPAPQPVAALEVAAEPPQPVAALPKVAEAAPQTPGRTFQAPLSTEFSGGNSGIEEPLLQVISSSREWKKLWKRHTAIATPPAELPEVDFNTHEVLVLFAGTKSTGGHSIAITRIENTEWEGRPARIVFYALRTPPAGAITTMALTQPYIMRIVPRISGSTFFRENR